MQGNTGYTLPPSNNSGGGGATGVQSGQPGTPQQPGQRKPIGVKSPHIQTDAQEWGYPEEKKKEEKKATKPKPKKPFELTKRGNTQGNEVFDDPRRCRGKTIGQREAQRARAIALFEETYPDVGEWDEVRRMRPTKFTIRAVSSAKAIYAMSVVINRCKESRE
jgi:hypothetical protein